MSTPEHVNSYADAVNAFADATERYAEALSAAADAMTYRSQAARDAAASGYGGESYWRYLDDSAAEQAAYYLQRGDTESAERMMTRSLSDALRGNEGD